jgi:hypothetical protein
MFLCALCESSACSALKIFAGIARKQAEAAPAPAYTQSCRQIASFGELTRPANILYCSLSPERRLQGTDALWGGRPAFKLGSGSRLSSGRRMVQLIFLQARPFDFWFGKVWFDEIWFEGTGLAKSSPAFHRLQAFQFCRFDFL